MAPARRSRSSLGAGALAVLLAAALAVYPAVQTGAWAPLVAAPGLLAMLVLLAALAFRLGALLPVTIVLLLCGYAAFLALERPDRGAPVVAAVLLLTAELSYWAVEPRSVGRSRSLVVRRSLLLAVLALGAAALASFLLGASALASAGGVVLAGLGVAAVVAALVVLAFLARLRLAP